MMGDCKLYVAGQDVVEGSGEARSSLVIAQLCCEVLEGIEKHRADP